MAPRLGNEERDAVRLSTLSSWIVAVSALTALTVVGTGCSGTKQADVTSLPALKDIDALIEDVVADPHRRDQMLELAAEFRRTAQIYFQQVAEVQIQVARAGVEYDAPRSDLESIQRRAAQSREARLDNLIELVLRGCEILTPAEWTALAAHRIEYVESLEEDER